MHVRVAIYMINDDFLKICQPIDDWVNMLNNRTKQWCEKQTLACSVCKKKIKSHHLLRRSGAMSGTPASSLARGAAAPSAVRENKTSPISALKASFDNSASWGFC